MWEDYKEPDPVFLCHLDGRARTVSLKSRFLAELALLWPDNLQPAPSHHLTTGARLCQTKEVAGPLSQTRALRVELLTRVKPPFEGRTYIGGRPDGGGRWLMA
jgi:hypothetical protein